MNFDSNFRKTEVGIQVETHVPSACQKETQVKSDDIQKGYLYN